MNWWIIIGIFVAVVIVMILFIYYQSPNAASSLHSIVYNNKTIFTSTKTIPNTSDGVSLIYYGSTTGIYSYNINTGATTLISSTFPMGLAYDNGLLVLDGSGNLYNYSVSQTAQIATGCTSLYSTVGGYELGQLIGGTTYVTYTGSKTAANGTYGNITYTVS